MHPLWSCVFGNPQPVEVEIGPGTGTFILAAAETRPPSNFFGVEHSRSRATRLQAAIESHRLRNARVIHADAACVVASLIPSASVAAYHIYFPDPWWKRRHHRRRLFTPTFAQALARTLMAGGRVFVATDVDDVLRLVRTTLQSSGLFALDHEVSPLQGAVTAFERKGLARGATIKRATFVKRAAPHTRPAAHPSKAAPMTPAESPS